MKDATEWQRKCGPGHRDSSKEILSLHKAYETVKFNVVSEKALTALDE